MGRTRRTRESKRDRRKAKQSKFQRAGRGNPQKIGHGGSGETQQTQPQTNIKNAEIEKATLGQPLAKMMMEAGITTETVDRDQVYPKNPEISK